MGCLTCAKIWVRDVRVHEGGSATNKSAPEFTRRDTKTAPHPPILPGNLTQGLQI